MKIHILAGGPASLVPDLKVNSSEDVKWVGVDRGVFNLLDSGIQPSYAFGDFDSVSSDQKRWLENQHCNVRVFPRAKDKTDLELALEWAIKQLPDSIVIFGATGGRIDHELANIGLLLLGNESGVTMQIVDHCNTLQIQCPGTHTILRDHHYQYVSFLPHFGRVKELTLEGFKYPLHKQDLYPGSALTVSNELIEEKGTYSFSEGILLMIRSRDEM